MRISGFISKAACRGYRPSKHVSHKGRQRPHLIARLTRERSTARFIVAPDGYGKTSVALDYAETMFSWLHVFWLNAKSPCFIRDLDGGGFAAAIREVDPEARLVIVDDLPLLDEVRAQKLSAEIDTLLAYHCEVLLSCTPSCDVFAVLQKDRVRMGVSDLLLTDEELDAMRSDEDVRRLATALVPASQRIPALVWGEKKEIADFASACFSEDLPSDLLFAAACALVLQKGSFDNLEELGPFDAQSASDVLTDYPHLGFDEDSGTFEASALDIEALFPALKNALDAVVAYSYFETRTELAQAWARMLIARGTKADRACDTIRVICPVKNRARWLVEHTRELIQCGSFFAMFHLLKSLKRGGYDAKDKISTIEAVCFRMLGDEDSAVRCAKRFAYKADASGEAREISLLILARFAPDELRKSAQKELRKIVAAFPEEVFQNPSAHEALVLAWLELEESVDSLAQEWLRLQECGTDDDVLCLVASWVFTLISRAGNDVSYDAALIAPIERFIRARLNHELAFVGFLAVSAGLSLEAAHMKGMRYADGPLPAATLLFLRQAEVLMFTQRRKYEQERREEQARRSSVDFASMSGVPSTSFARVEQRAIPTLELQLFGHLEARIGGTSVNPKLIGRKQVRVMLVLLAANQGRDLPRDSVANTMWPTRSIENARKNFYTIWCHMRQAFTLPDGSCPYLVRHNYGCRFDERYVKSDIARLGEICRQLTFGKLDFDEWRDLQLEIDHDFANDVLPFEEGSQLIEDVRDDCRNRLVDGLVTGSIRLAEAGSPEGAVWFARAAIGRIRTREDAYVALMRAQIAHKQRTAAMSTYFDCRRVLADELGIDPSPETTALYESLLD